ncbi:hypothetical protein N4P33_23160 [Streptomyces sp. 15-116A]|nr:hypothetical protein [Streptomyces sp. 15-116A]
MNHRARLTAPALTLMFLGLATPPEPTTADGPPQAPLPAPAARTAPPTGAPGGDGRPGVEVSRDEAGTGGSITVTGTGWRPRTLLMLLICGQATPAGGVTGGTASCANADGRTVTTDPDGRFRRTLPVVEPPVPCPCVVHAETVTGATADADAAFQVAGHSIEPLPAEATGGRLSPTTDARLEGTSTLLTRFGSPPARTLTLTVANVGTSPVRDPVFQIGTSHGVYAPSWQPHPWRGTVPPGGRARIELPVQLPAGAHGDYTISLKYAGKLLAEHPWTEPHPWGVTLFWTLTFLTVPAAAYRAAMALLDRTPPRPTTKGPRTHQGVRGPYDETSGDVSERRPSSPSPSCGTSTPRHRRSQPASPPSRRCPSCSGRPRRWTAARSWRHRR